MSLALDPTAISTAVSRLAEQIIDASKKETIEPSLTPSKPIRIENDDPLAQSFLGDESGAFLTSVDLYFKSKGLYFSFKLN